MTYLAGLAVIIIHLMTGAPAVFTWHSGTETLWAQQYHTTKILHPWQTGCGGVCCCVPTKWCHSISWFCHVWYEVHSVCYYIIIEVSVHIDPFFMLELHQFAIWIFYVKKLYFWFQLAVHARHSYIFWLFNFFCLFLNHKILYWWFQF